MPPTVVLLQTESDLHKRTPLRPLGFADEAHSGFLRRAIGLARVAFDARANNVFPRRRPAAIARNDVIEIQIVPVEMAAAVLTKIFVALKNVMARELDFLFRQPVVNEEQNNSRHADAKRNCVNGFFARRVFGNVAPFLKVERAERSVVAVEDDVRLALKQKCEGAPGGADVDRLPQPVQHQHVLIERGIHGRFTELDINKKAGAGQLAK